MQTERPLIGLALGGGGIRGLAHLGVLEVLEEAHIPVDYLAGTSMGGLVGAVYAAGVPVADAIAFAKRLGLIDIASPDGNWRGLFGHAKIAKLLTELLGSDALTFEDLRIPLSVVATDIERGEMVVFNRGPLIPALLATSAFPIMFAPLQYEERWLIDGGMVNNLPVDLVRQMGAERVLGVNVPPSVTLSPEHDAEQGAHDRLSLRALFSSFSHRAQDWQLPLMIAETGCNLPIEIANRERLRRCPSNVLLEIHQPNTGTFATEKGTAAIEAGRKAALAAISEIVKLRDTPRPRALQLQWQRFNRRLRRAWDAFNAPDVSCYPSQQDENLTQRR